MTESSILPLFYAAVFCITSLVAYCLTFLMIVVSNKIKFLDYPHGRRTHKYPMPCLGGAAVFWSFWGVILAGYLAGSMISEKPFFIYLVENTLQGIPRSEIRIFWVFFGGLVIHVAGLVDDKHNWSPAKKFLFQMIAAAILLKLGITTNLVPFLGTAGYVLTFIWILLMINAFNLIDSIDGHCAGVALISSLTFFWISQLTGQPVVSFFLTVFAGSLFGFLPHNTSPAKTFLGDNGSLFIGYMLAAFTLLCRYENPAVTYATFFIPVIAFGVPIYDTISVIIVRLLHGIPPWKADRNHFAHRLVRIGMNDRMATVFSYFASITLGLVAILMTQVGFFGAILTGLIFLSIIGVLAFLEFYAVETIRRMEMIEMKKEHLREARQKR